MCRSPVRRPPRPPASTLTHSVSIPIVFLLKLKRLQSRDLAFAFFPFAEGGSRQCIGEGIFVCDGASSSLAIYRAD